MIILLTGITGLVGCHVAITLLQEGHSVLAVARNKDGLSGEKRARRILESHPEYGTRFGLTGLHVIEGDILEQGCGIAEETLSMLSDYVDTAIHCAGDVAFTRQTESSLRANVDGVRNFSELIHAVGCHRLVHVGTAYIEQGLRGMGFRTPYEESKFAGEQCLKELSDRYGIDLKIVRPSIVTGDSRCGFTPTYHGIYPFLRYAAEYAGDLSQVSALDALPSGFVPDAKINLVPADFVAAIIREVAGNTEIGDREFNVINHHPWSARELCVIIAKHAGIGGDVFSRTAGPRPPLSASITGAASMLQETYGPYFDVALDIDTASTDRVIESAGLSVPGNTEEWIASLLEWGMRHGWKELA